MTPSAWIALTLIFAVGLYLRCRSLSASLWLDELHTSWTVAGPIGELPGRAAMGNHSRLYFLLPWLSTRLFGSNEIALRLPSLLAGAALIPTAFVLARRWTGSHSAALLAAALVAIGRQHFVFYSQEARAYAVVQMVAAWHVALLLHVMDRPTRFARAGLIAGAAALFYLHYTTALLLLAEAVFFGLLWLRRGARPAYRPAVGLVDAAIVVVGCLPAVPHLMHIAAHRDNWAMFIEQVPFLSVLTLFPLQTWLLLPALLLGVWMLVQAIARDRPLMRGIDARAAVLTVCWLAAPLLAAWMATHTDVARLFFRRYLMISALAGVLLGASVVALAPRRWMRAVAVVVVLALAVWPQMWAVRLPHAGVQRWTWTVGSLWRDRDGFYFLPQRSEDWRGAVAAVNDGLVRRPAPVLVYPALIEADALRDDTSPLLRDYCLLPVNSIYRIHWDAEGSPGATSITPLPTTRPEQLDDALVAEVARHGGGWLILRAKPERAAPIAEAIAGRLRQAGGDARVANTRVFDGVSVARIIVDVEST